jgi:hypothetical protein
VVAFVVACAASVPAPPVVVGGVGVGIVVGGRRCEVASKKSTVTASVGGGVGVRGGGGCCCCCCCVCVCVCVCVCSCSCSRSAGGVEDPCRRSGGVMSGRPPRADSLCVCLCMLGCV